jgi:hypothetical protein
VRLQGRTVDDGWLVVLRKAGDAASVQALQQAFGLTPRESEVLYRVAEGKTCGPRRHRLTGASPPPNVCREVTMREHKSTLEVIRYASCSN